MAFLTANGGQFKWLGSAAASPATTQVAFDYISARFSIGALAEIDITSTTSPEREYAKGFDSGRTIEIECFMDSVVVTRVNLDTWKAICGQDRLEWWMTAGCTAPVAATEAFCATLYDYSIDAELDGALKATMKFRLEDGAACALA
mgnify:CR=1 FL=1